MVNGGHLIKYFSLNEAREEIKKRWDNVDLKKKVEKELGKNFIPFFDSDKPRSVLFRQLISPDNGFSFFYQESKYIDTKPAVIEYLDDMFVSFNDEKKGYGRLHINSSYIDIIDFHASEKLLLKDLVTKKGENLVEFHHNLIKESGLGVDIFDMSEWFKSIGKAKDYYYLFLLHFLTHGVLFENFILDEEDDKEVEFTRSIVLPAIDKIRQKFNLEPIIIKMYPDQQTKEEDTYWWSYPPYMEKKIITCLEEKNYLKIN